MTDKKLCFRHKFGYCKYNRQCPQKNVDDICENPDCHVSKCDLRHPKECIWFRDFQWCKFQSCAYKHENKKNKFKKEVDILNYKIKKLEELIKQKETEEIDQLKKVNNLEKSEREKCLEAKVSALEKFVVRLEEKLELLEHEDKGIEETDFSTFDKLHALVRSDSLKRTCEQCEFVARNEARLNVHKEIKHNHT